MAHIRLIEEADASGLLAGEYDAAVERGEGVQGLDDHAVSDAIQVVSYFNYVTRVADGVGIDDEPEWVSA